MRVGFPYAHVPLKLDFAQLQLSIPWARDATNVGEFNGVCALPCAHDAFKVVKRSSNLASPYAQSVVKVHKHSFGFSIVLSTCCMQGG